MNKWQRILFQPNIPLGEKGERITASKRHRELSKNAAKEGMVLLKNNQNVLPLGKGSKVALFGKGSFDYVKGGGGSGDVTVEYITNLYDGMKTLKKQVSIFEELSDFYREDVKKQYISGAVPGMTVEPKVPEDLLKRASIYTDTAIITICRFSGEGWDRKSVVDTKNKNLWEHEEALTKKSGELFENGDFYLTHAESDMVNKVKEHFAKVIVVMNVGGMVDTSWFVKDDTIHSVLMAWQGGMEGGLAAAELLCGIGSPSGKLSDTFANRLEDYPSTYNFHEAEAYVDYTDDIYVGYRYFETIPGAADKVNYPFGFGLSYTKFHWSVVSAKEQKGIIEVRIHVTNIGGIEGKEILQIYVGAPQGLLGKPAKSLVAFKKTRLLKAGESQLLSLEFSVETMASYDDLGKVQKSAYVLEAGDYTFFVGNSVRDVEKIDFIYSLPQDKVALQLSEKIAPTSLKERMLADGRFEQLPLKEANDPDASGLPKMSVEMTEGYTPAVRLRQSYQLWKEPFKKGIRTFYEVAEGKMTVDAFLAQMSDEEVAHLLGGQPNTGVANTFGYGNMPEYGIPNIMTADGPAGLRIAPECGVSTTAWPCSTLLACTWDQDIVYAVGEAGAKEVKENNIAIWLTPAINIHRSPLCGRNFEYYSEDPFLTGKMAAAMVKGIQSQHIGATVKHFALNNKETNRKNSDSRVSERAAREIYLKAFELVVKEAAPWSIMTSYNMINGHRASESRELLEDILRGEWDFKGMVTTDWWTCGEHYKETKAGNDVKMGCGYPERLLEAKALGLISREDMNLCAKRILELILKVD
ncbi:glycoside hydrolase family 3 protein [Cellulosilyticum sp. I15G10I2]|uniref:glycoside hydrolase family 3 protein n=1 Tax=Cellulosilyticum sp. I15G10I2 TaxID=1892843 RepID=UPI00085C5FE9|nr:glycoside hydrolase family 3 protein [Cellulosilyticum sp. I15G10I2]